MKYLFVLIPFIFISCDSSKVEEALNEAGNKVVIEETEESPAITINVNMELPLSAFNGGNTLFFESACTTDNDISRKSNVRVAITPENELKIHRQDQFYKTDNCSTTYPSNFGYNIGQVTLLEIDADESLVIKSTETYSTYNGSDNVMSFNDCDMNLTNFLNTGCHFDLFAQDNVVTISSSTLIYNGETYE